MDKEAPEINTDILRINGKYFAVKRIEAQNIDINEELKDLYDKRHNAHVQTLNDGVVEASMKDWNTQIDHIRSFDGKSTHTIPSKHMGKPVMVFNNIFLLLRVINYAPHECSTSYGYIMTSQQKIKDIKAIKNLVKYKEEEGSNPMYSNDTLIIKFKPLVNVPIIVGFDERGGKLYLPMQKTFHTMSDRHQCTGHHTGMDYWKLKDTAFARELSKINLFSPAQDTMMIDDVRWTINDMITPDNFISVAKGGTTEWSA